MYARLLSSQLEKKWFSGKVIIVTGARQVGKTTLINAFIEEKGLSDKRLFFNCDNPSDRSFLSQKDIENLIGLIGDAKIIFIDEGQKVSSIGQTLKLLVDYYGKEKQIIVSGSSSINLLSQTQEALTGRKWVFHLYPLSLEEVYPDKNMLLLSKELEEKMIFGMYPEVITLKDRDDKIDLLEELCSSYLYKDIFEFQQIKNPDILYQLLKALALQIGSEVSNQELAQLLGIDKNTVERYIDLLEKNFVIFRLRPFFKNKRKEISKKKKIFFYDTGIRNTIISDYRPLDSRTDKGSLWENFIIAERMKFRHYHRIRCQAHFWRTLQRQEVDLIEECEGGIHAYEIKWNPKKAVKIPVGWKKAYPAAKFEWITPLSLLGFVIQK